MDDQKSSNHLLFHPSAASESNMTDLLNNGVGRASKRDDVAKTMITDTQSLNSMDCKRLSRAETITDNYFSRSTTTEHRGQPPGHPQRRVTYDAKAAKAAKAARSDQDSAYRHHWKGPR